MQALLDLDILAIKTQIRPEDIDNAKASLSYNAVPLSRTINPADVPVAIVGYGPSLRSTWEQIKDFPVVISTSGAHDFLIERDIIPRYHVECDPREHKARFTESPILLVQYLIASTAHPKIWRNLKEMLVQRWHFDGLSDMPEGETILPTYGDVGQMAIYIAKYLGYQKMGLFGLDYSYTKDKIQHADEHGNEIQNGVGFVKGTSYVSQLELIKNLKFFDILMEENRDIELSIYGDGLLSNYLEAKYAL